MANFKIEEGLESNGLLTLSSSTSQIVASGNLKVTGDFQSVTSDSRYVLTSSYNSNLTSSVQAAGDARYTQTVNTFSGTVSIVAGPNITVNSGSGQIVITGSAGAVTTSLNGYSGSLQILAGPNITVNSGSGFIMITGSAGGPGGGEVTGSDNFFVTTLLKVSGTITNPVGHLILSSSVGSTVTVSGGLVVANTILARGKIYNDSGDIILSSSNSKIISSGNIVIPLGGGPGLGGYGIGIGTTSPWDAVDLRDGNFRVEGTNEHALIFKRSGLANGPQFSLGRIILGGDGSPEFRVLYQDDVTTERSIFEFDRMGIFASVKPTGSYGSHWEGFIAGDVQPMFRLNSFPSMSFEAGQGSGSWTDAILRRKRAGHFHILSQLSGGTPVTGNLDVANIYSSEGHLHLSSSAGSTIAVSGNLKVIGDITSNNLDSRYVLTSSYAAGSTTSINGYSGSVSILAGPNITVNSGSGFIMITGSAGAAPTDISALNTFSQSVNGFTASFSSSVRSIGDTRYVLTSSFDTFSGSVNAFTASQQIFNAAHNTVSASVNIFTASFNLLSQSLNTFSASHNAFSQSINGFTSSFTASVQSIGDARYPSLVNYDTFTGLINPLTQSLNAFTASHNVFSQSVNGFTASFTGSVQSIGDARYTRTINSVLGVITITAGPAITINTAGQDISISGTGADLTGLNAFSATINAFTQSINGFTASFTGSVQSIGDARYANLTTFNSFVSTTNTLTQSLNSFSATINNFTQSINGFTSSFSSSVQSIGDARYTLQSAMYPFTASINTFSQSVNTFSASQLTFNSAHNTFSASVNTLSQSWGTKTITAIFDGGGQVLVAGAKAYINEIPYNSTITGWRIASPQTGDCVVDVWRDQYANWPPTVADTIISGAEKPTLSAANKNEDKALSTWQTTNVAGDGLVFNVDSAATVTYVVLQVFLKIP
jgi:ABC-type transporter Mla subunit MlaD